MQRMNRTRELPVRLTSNAKITGGEAVPLD